MTTAQNPSVTTGRRLMSFLPIGLALIVTLVLLGGVASAQDAPLAAWRQALAQVDVSLKSVKADDAAARASLEQQLGQLRSEITTWLASYPPAQNETWLMPAPASLTRIEDLAAEASHLRAAIALIDTSLNQGREGGTFYLGVVDVAVTTEPISATAEMTPAGASVVSASDIRTYDRDSLSEALALAPGVSFVRGGTRNESTVTVRGFDIRQVPVFIDGIPVYTPYDGYADLERFTTFDVAELRISKSFSSVLYGPNALGGAINVVSRRPSRQLEGTGGLSVGSGITWNSFANLGSRFDKGYVQGGASYLEADTFPLSDDFTPTALQGAGDRDNAYRRDSKFNMKSGYTPNGTDEYAISYVGQRGKKGNPLYAGSDRAARARYWKWPYWNKDSVYFVSNTGLGNAGYLRGRVYYDRYDNELDSYDDKTYTTQTRSSSFRSVYADRTVGGSVEWGKTFRTRQTLRAAFHVKDDAHAEHNVGAPITKIEGRLTSLGVEDTFSLSPNLSLVAGISGDRQTTSQAQNNRNNVIVDLPRGATDGVNPQAGLFYSVSGSGTVRATVSRKTRLPSMKDRYSFKSGFAVPNPELKPERNTTFETGYQGVVGARTSFSVSAFYSRITDLIQQFYLATDLTQQRNIGRASAAGLEIDARSRTIPRVDINVNYSALRRKNLSDPSVLPVNAPRHKGLASANVELMAHLRMIGIFEFESGRRIQNPSALYLDIGSIVTLNAKAIWTVREEIDAEIGVTNMTDKNYWLEEGFPEPGRMVQANLRFRF